VADAPDMVLPERIESRILLLRGLRVLLAEDLAVLYEVEVRVLNQAVARNAERFPADFMFQLTGSEVANLRSQIVTSNSENCAAALKSQSVISNADEDNPHPGRGMRAFVHLRRMLGSNADLAWKLAALEKKYDGQFKVVFDAIRALMTPPDAKKRRAVASGPPGQS
jgi:hypothetical protein